MGNTTRYGWGYPEVTDPPNLSLYIKNLAEAAEATVGALDDARGAAAQPIGTQVGYAEIAADSATWNSATKIVTNVTATFPGVAGATYEVEVDATWAASHSSSTGITTAFGIAWRLGNAGSVANTDPLIGARMTRAHPASTGLNSIHLYGRFTAASSGTHCVAAMGWSPGDTQTTGFKAFSSSPALSTNIIRVKRVA